MKHSIGGVIAALPTPFLEGGGVNKKELAKLIEYLIGRGVTGFYVGGSSAEVFLLTPEERMTVYETAAEAATGRVAMIAHVGAIATDDCVRYANRARECGYDAVSAIAPFYFKFTLAQIETHYRTVAAAAELPILVYNFPALTGVNMSMQWLSDMLSDSRFIGVKHTSSDLYMLEQIKTAHPDKAALCGDERLFLAGLSMGADGAIGSMFNFMPDHFLQIYRLHKEKKAEEAFALQQEINRIATALGDISILVAQKEILCQMGFDFGYARAPFPAPTEEEKEILRREITSRL